MIHWSIAVLVGFGIGFVLSCIHTLFLARFVSELLGRIAAGNLITEAKQNLEKKNENL